MTTQLLRVRSSLMTEKIKRDLTFSLSSLSLFLSLSFSFSSSFSLSLALCLFSLSLSLYRHHSLKLSLFFFVYVRSCVSKWGKGGSVDMLRSACVAENSELY